MSYAIAGFVVFAAVVYWALGDYISKRLKLLKLPKLPIPYNPISGHVLSIPTDNSAFFRFFEKTCHTLSPNAKFGVFWVGLKADVFVIHPDPAEIILKSHINITKAKKYDITRSWIGDGLAMSKGKKWYQRRKMITPSFHYDILKDFLCVMNEQSNVFVDMIGNMICNGEEIDIQQRLKLCTLDIICETAMGCRINAQKREELEYVQTLKKLPDLMLSRLLNPIHLASDFIYSLSSRGKQYYSLLGTLHKFTRDVIEKKLLEPEENTGNSSKRKAFLDMLITAQNEDGSSLSADDLQEEVDTFMFAGHDTTSTTLMWAIYLLGRYPNVQKKLHEELDSVFGGDKTCDVTFDHIKDLTYLDLVIKETLRMYPPAPFIARSLEEDCILDGMVVPKNTDLSINIYYIHRHPEIWDQPNKFIPERFETENRIKANRSHYAYIPFSAGPRNCVGQRFAVQELKVILAKFFRNFSMVCFDKEEELTVNIGLVLELKQKLNFKIEKRV